MKLRLPHPACSLALASLTLAACSAAPASEPTSGTASPRLETAPDVLSNTHLASLVFPEDHAVRFYRTGRGEVIAMEEGRLGQASLLAPIKDLSPIDLFVSLAPDLEVPSALANAARDAEPSAPRTVAVDAAAKDSSSSAPEAGRRPGITPDTPSESAWFRANICAKNHPRNCLTGYDWANGGYNSDDTMKGRYTAWAYVGSESPNTSQLEIDAWECSDILCFGHSWQATMTTTISPGRWASLVNTTRRLPYSFRAKTWINGGGHGTIGIADEYN